MNVHRDGIALIAVVLALVVLEAAVAGALYLASLEVRTTRTLAAHARAALASESALAAALARWPADTIAALAHGDTVTLVAAPAVATTVRIEHVGGGSFLITATAGHALAGASAAALVRWFAPAAFAPSLPAALTVGGTANLADSATVDGALTPTACTAADSIARATFSDASGIAAPQAAAITVAPSAVLAGSPPAFIASALTHPAAFAHLGPLDTAAFARLADRVESGSIALAPQNGPGPGPHSCATASAGNWGAPAQPTHTCADYVPIVFAPSDLTLAAGSGQALLLVAGNLTIAAAAELHGIAIVLGDATVRGRVEGALRVLGDAVIEGEVRRDPCALWRALTLPAALAGPHRARRRWRLPTF